MKDYKQFRWFYTRSGALVVGGKNATQNDYLLNKIISMKKDYYVMHTSSPGSPFSAIIKDLDKVSDKDIEECAIFTGCFSRAWKEKKKKIKVDVFYSSQISKEGIKKEGMWRVYGKIKSLDVELKLTLTRQKKILRAVPLITIDKPIIILCPGNIDKNEIAIKLKVEFGKDFNQNELVSALPSGGIKICK